MQKIIYILLVFSFLGCNQNQKLVSFLNPAKEIFLDLKDINKFNEKFNEVSFLFIIDTSGSMPNMNNVLSKNINFLAPIFEEYPYYTYNFAFTTMSPSHFFDSKSLLSIDKENCGLESSDFFVSTNIGSYFHYSFDQNLQIQPNSFLCLISHNIKTIKGHNSAEPFFDSFSYILRKSDKAFKSRFFSPDNFLILFFISDAYGEDDKRYKGFLSTNEDYEKAAENFAEEQWSILHSVKGEANNIRSYAVVVDNKKSEQCGGENAGTGPDKYPFHLYRFIKKTGGLRVSLCDEFWGEKLKRVYIDLRDSFFSRKIYLEEVPKLDTLEVLFNGKKVPRDRVSGWYFQPEDVSIRIADGFNIFVYPKFEKSKHREGILTIRYHPINIELLRTED